MFLNINKQNKENRNTTQQKSRLDKKSNDSLLKSVYVKNLKPAEVDIFYGHIMLYNELEKLHQDSNFSVGKIVISLKVRKGNYIKKITMAYKVYYFNRLKGYMV